MEKKYTLCAVTQTHWDREWYMNYQKTRIKLTHLIDDLLEILDNDPDFYSFMLDGQVLPLCDYLEVKPYNRERLEKYIRNGRLVIGPWYILPDEILITGEAHIRNYLMGSRVAKEFGAEKMQIGYLPDSFGHPSQMPQILDKLGMKSAMFWRGATAEIDKTEFNWQSPDGSKVLAVLLPDSYATGAELPDDPAATAKRLDSYIARYAGMSSTDLIYYSNGGDHLEPVPYLSGLLKKTNPLMKNGRIIHTTLPRFMTELKEKLTGTELETIRGELCGTHTAVLLASTLSTRTYLKQEYHRSSHLLENYLEPVYSFAALQGNAYPRDIFVLAWRYLLQNLPHDSICGCSVDEVHRDMLFRFHQIYEIAGELDELLAKFYRRIDTADFEGGYALTVFNTTSNPRTDVLEATVDVDAQLLSEHDHMNMKDDGSVLEVFGEELRAARPLPTSFEVFDGDKKLACVLESAFVSNKLDLDYFRFPHQYNVNRCRISFLAENVPAMGYKTFKVVPHYGDVIKISSAGSEKCEIENEYFRIVPGTDGSIAVTDLATGRTLKGLNTFADGGDCGDEYTYCPPESDSRAALDPATVTAAVKERSELREVLEIAGVMHTPASLVGLNTARTAETVDCAFTVEIVLNRGVKRVDIRTAVDNRAKYHRLRVLFPTSVFSEYSWSSGAFSVDRRPVDPPAEPNPHEIFSTHPEKDFCEVNDGKYGLTVANRGLNEYEVYHENGQSVIALTLLRCVGQISRQTLKTRAEPGGWNEKAPDAQCLGPSRFEYSLIPHEGDWQSSESYVGAHEFNVALRPLQVPEGVKGELPGERCFLCFSRREFILSAFKKCEFDDTYLVRFFNSTGKTVSGGVTFGFEIKKVESAGLNEEAIEVLAHTGGDVKIEAKPFEIITLKVTV